MYEGALGILDHYGVRERLAYLYITHGYRIKVIGHSLGEKIIKR
jgi:hypothetical protein